MCEECLEIAVDEHETTYDLVCSILGPTSKEEANAILWGYTAYPFGKAKTWVRQLMDFRFQDFKDY